MNGADALSTIAEVAMALTGFTGILTVFRHQQHWTQIELIALSHLLGIGIGASFFALLPMPLLASSLPIAVTWRLCLPALGFGIMGLVVWNDRNRRRHHIRPRWRFAYWPLQSLGFGLAALLIGAAFTSMLRHPALYLAGLLWMVLVGMLQFMVQVLRSLPPPKDN